MSMLSANHHTDGKIKLIEKNCFSLIWEIQEYDESDEETGMYVSPKFTTGKNNENIWMLYLTTTEGQNDSTKGFHPTLEITLDKKSKNSETIISFSFSVMVGNNSSCKSLFFKKQGTLQCTRRVSYDLISVHDIVNDIKKTPTRIQIQFDVLDSSAKEICGTDRIILGEISIDFQYLLESQKYSDLVLIAEGERFLVHKCVLLARCPVLMGLLEASIESENLNDEVDIFYYSKDVIRELLNFIYTGRVHDIVKVASSLIDLAEDYKLVILQEMCYKSLRENLTIENAFDTLVTAHCKKQRDLRFLALGFIAENFSDFPKKMLDEFKESPFRRLLDEILNASKFKPL
ncbi:hypothetical protein QAD02_000134 [Eretmocerus hayati]|uniref:Uncharacterized protein n=1 Tax=Eretmocerus hayati TaxID=131215 RepID=A0ACC2NCI8_9HYME|nr:hypothetical protein QAD02_000134 [Eretmocerus hayati]